LTVAGGQEAWEAELSVMAADQEMHREVHEINAEFNAAEADGLERH
jgi:hypothetical protein